MIICTHCNKEIPGDSSYCNYCGKKIREQSRQIPPFLKNRKNLLFIGIIALLFIAGFIILMSSDYNYLILGGPPNVQIHSDGISILDYPHTKVKITDRIKCKNLPPEVKVRGVTEVWLIGILGDDYPDPIVKVYAKQDGNWHQVMSDECP